MEYYTDTNLQAAPVQENRRNGRSGGKIVGSIILSIFLFFTIMGIYGLIVAGKILTPSIVEKAIKNIDVKEISASIIDANNDKLLADYLREELYEIEYFKDVPADELDKFIDKDVMPYVAEIAGDAAEVVFEGKGEININAESFAELVSKSDIEGINSIEIDDKLISEINAEFDKMNINETVKNINNGQIAEAFKLVKLAISGIAMGICCILAFIFVISIVLVNRRYGRAILMHIGIPLLIAGILFVISAIGTAGTSILGIAGIQENIRELAIIVEKTIVPMLYMIGGISAAVGALMIVFGCLIPNKDK